MAGIDSSLCASREHADQGGEVLGCAEHTLCNSAARKRGTMLPVCCAEMSSDTYRIKDVRSVCLWLAWNLFEAGRDAGPVLGKHA